MSDKHTSTCGWDTVFAIPILKVNEAIVYQKTSPTGFQWKNEKDNSYVKGDFGDWQIINGGDGAFIYFSIPVKNVTGALLANNFSWEAFSLTVEVSLNFLEDVIEKNPSKNTLKLMIKSKASDPDDIIVSLIDTIKEDSSGKNTRVKITSSTKSDSPTEDYVLEHLDDFESLISNCIIEWLKENIVDFNHVFATVDLNNYIDKDTRWAWCKPSDVNYAYTNGSEEDGIKTKSLLAVLCMTGGNKSDGSQIQKIDSYAIPQKSIAGFLISEKVILNELILPTLPLRWKDTSESDYELIHDDTKDTGKYETVLRLKDGKSIKLDDITHGGISYTPYIKELKISLQEDSMVFESYTETEVGLGNVAWCRTIHYYTITLGKNKNGEQTLIYKKLKEPDIYHDVKQEGNTSTEFTVVTSVIGAILELIVSTITSGIARIVLSIIIGLVTGVVAPIPEYIESYNENTSPSIDLLVNNSTNPIVWNASGIFNLNYADLAGPLRLGGTPNFNF